MTKLFIFTLAFAGIAFGQQPGTAASPVPPVPNPEVYNRAIKILQDQDAPGPKVRKKKTDKAPDISGAIGADVVHASRQIPLTPTAQHALNLSEAWIATGPLPIEQQGRVVYQYGRTLATVVCAIYQVCEIDLEPGEKLTADALDWGDTGFLVSARMAGSGAEQYAYLVVKPTAPGLDTTAVVGTDRRSYYIRLISTPHEHMARVAFTYPEEEAARRKATEAAKIAEQQRQEEEAKRLAKLNTLGPIRNWKYSVELHGKDAKFLKPESIGDDGIHTHIKLPAQARYRGLPTIQISDAQGPIPANTHWDGNNELIVDALFEKGCLIEGVGRKQQRACITNHGLGVSDNGVNENGGN